MNAYVALNEGMYASWIRGSSTALCVNRSLKKNLKSKYNMKVEPSWFQMMYELKYKGYYFIISI